MITLACVKKEFQKADAQSRIENWEEEARIFFEYHESIGWRDPRHGDMRPLWRQRAAYWITRKAREQAERKQQQQLKQQNNNGQIFYLNGRPTRFDPRRGIDPGDPETVDWDAPF